MMELIREWLLGIVGVAFLLALAEGLMPEGGAKKVGKFTGGLLLFLVMFRPIAAFDLDELPRELERYQWETEAAIGALEQENQKLIADIIEEDLAAYIEEKASVLGADCTAEVTFERNDSDMQVPNTVRLMGVFPAGTQEELCRIIAEELNIPEERQSYIQEEVE